jgi:HEAT repeat protein
MAFYDLPKQERAALANKISDAILKDLQGKIKKKTKELFSDEDTYIRKCAYLATGRIYFLNQKLQSVILHTLQELLKEADFKIRQTVINAAGEIGKKEFEPVQFFFDQGLFDPHHSPRNAVIGSVKKMGEVNPKPVMAWAKKFLHHEDKEIRREICHGIELRGRKHPQDILPLLKELQHDKTSRVRTTLVHVLGQISYKKGCLQIVVEHLNHWENRELVSKAIEEIIDVHERYKDFSALTQKEAKAFINKNLK